MKYKVIGWTSSDNTNIPSAPLTFAARHAIVDEIKSKGYLFSGYDHQEAMWGCPVLSDGKKRDCSQRGFASIMAEAHGETAPYSYSVYMFAIKKEAVVAPQSCIYGSVSPRDEDGREEFELDVSQEIYAQATTENEISIEDLPSLKFIETTDTLTLKCNGTTTAFEVTNVNRGKKMPKGYDLSSLDFSLDKLKEYAKISASIPVLLHIKLKRKN